MRKNHHRKIAWLLIMALMATGLLCCQQTAEASSTGDEEIVDYSEPVVLPWQQTYETKPAAPYLMTDTDVGFVVYSALNDTYLPFGERPAVNTEAASPGAMSAAYEMAAGNHLYGRVVGQYRLGLSDAEWKLDGSVRVTFTFNNPVSVHPGEKLTLVRLTDEGAVVIPAVISTRRLKISGVIFSADAMGSYAILGVSHTEPASFTVTFMGADEDVIETRALLPGQPVGALPEAPAREGWIFTGWVSGNGEPVDETTPVTGDMTVIASYMQDYPTVEAYAATDTMNVYVKVPEGALPADASFRMAPVNSEDCRAAVEAALGGAVGEIQAVDMSFVGADGAEYQPLRPVTVQVTLTGMADAESLSVVHIRADGQAEVVYSGMPETVRMRGAADRKTFFFEADGFSVYAVAAITLNTMVTTGDGVTYDIQVTYHNTSGIPMEGTALSVSEILPGNDRYDAYIAASAEEVGTETEGIAFARVFDIKIVSEEDPKVVYEPIGDVDVSIRLVGAALTEYGNVSVLHFADGEDFSAAGVKADIKEETVDFTTDSFSVYVVAGYTMVRTISAGDGNTYEVALTFEEDALLPDDAELKVVELAEDDRADYLGRAAAAMDAGSFAYGRVFDISIVDGEGAEVQPNVKVRVTVNLLDAVDAQTEFAVFHFNEEENSTEPVDAVTDGGRVRFSAEGFSVYAIVEGPAAIPLGWARVSSMDDLAVFVNGAKGLYIGQKSGYYFDNVEYAGRTPVGITRTSPAASSPGAAAKQYYFEAAGGGNQFYIYCIVGDSRQYLYQNDTNLYLKDESLGQKTAFTVTPKGSSEFTLQSGNMYVNMRDNNRFCTKKNSQNEANSRFYFWYEVDTIRDPYQLDGKTYGLMNWNNGVSGRALMGEANGSALKGKALTVMTQQSHNEKKLYVPNDSDITQWTFEWVELDKYYVKTNGKYIHLASNGASLVDTPDDNCKLQVIPGTGIYEGQISLKGSKALYYSGNIDTGFTAGGTNGQQWLYLLNAQDELPADYFRVYSATEASVMTPQDGDRVIIYCRVWNETSGQYEFYAINQDGTLVPCYESGNEIQWVGGQLNTLLWNFVEYTDDNGSPTYYYELYNQYSEQFLAPQISGQITQGSTIGINLTGRKNGAYYSTIATWDDDHYSYACLKADPETGRIVSIPYSQAGDTPDAVDFAFAIVQDLPVDDVLHTVGTLDHERYGITMRIIDLSNSATNNMTGQMNGFLGNTTSNGSTHNQTSGLLSTNLNGNGYPTATKTSRNLAELYSGAKKVNHLFIESIYRSSGYFTFDSCQNFASLQGTDFVVYKELGTYDGSDMPTRKHGQFFPFNTIKPGDYATVNGKNLYSNIAVELPESDPRKYEMLHLIRNVNTYFAAELEASFIQTTNGLDAWGHDIIYEFTGDDDFWLYVDGELVIDLGGIHSAIGGSVNYRTGEVNVNGTRTTLRELFIKNYMGRENVTREEAEQYVDNHYGFVQKNGHWVFSDNSPHTMRIFYMERGAGASNLRMRFNLASVKPGTVQLTKQLAGVSSSESVTAEFPYQIYYSLDGGNHGQLLELKESEDDQGNKVYNVTNKDNGRPINYRDEITINGVTYHNVFLLRAGETAEIDFSKEIVQTEASDDILYQIIECGINEQEYDPVSINGSVATGEQVTIPDPDHPDQTVAVPHMQDYPTGYDTTKRRAKVTYENTVKRKPKLTITKRLFLPDQVTEVFGYDDDDTIFDVRLSLGTEYDEAPTPTYMYAYHIKDRNGKYCVWSETLGQFVSCEYTDFATFMAEDPDKAKDATFNSGIWGSISKIPAGYQIELLDVLPGTKYMVEERPEDIPLGYDFLWYIVDQVKTGEAQDGQALPKGTINYDNVSVEVCNVKGNGLIVNKTWSDAASMKRRDSTYFAVFKVGGSNDDLTLVPDSVKEMPYNNDPDSDVPAKQTLSWYYLSLPLDGSLNDYVVREVVLENPRTDAQGNLIYDDISPVAASHFVTLGGQEKGADVSSYFDYVVTYTDGAVEDNIRIFDVNNYRAGILLVKQDWDGDPLEDAGFSLKSGDANPVNFTSGEDGLITETHIRSGVDYVLTETTTPSGYIGLRSPVTIRLENGDVTVSGSDADAAWHEVTVDAASGLPMVIIKNRPYIFEAIKVDATDEDIKLQGVHFELHVIKTVDGVTGPDPDPMPGYEDLVTDANGIIPKLTEDLPAGSYELREKAAPTGYTKRSSFQFAKSPTGVITLIGQPEGVTLTGPTEVEHDTDGTLAYKMTVRNTRLTNMEVIKQVTGNMGDRTKKFGFTVVVTRSKTDLTPLTGDWLTEFELKHGEKVTLTVPAGLYVTLTETRAFAYDTTVAADSRHASSFTDLSIDPDGVVPQDDNGRRVITFTVPVADLGAKPVLTVTNHYEVEIDTGVNLEQTAYLILLVLALAGAAAVFAVRRGRRKG